MSTIVGCLANAIQYAATGDDAGGDAGGGIPERIITIMGQRGLDLIEGKMTLGKAVDVKKVNRIVFTDLRHEGWLKLKNQLERWAEADYFPTIFVLQPMPSLCIKPSLIREVIDVRSHFGSSGFDR